MLSDLPEAMQLVSGRSGDAARSCKSSLSPAATLGARNTSKHSICFTQTNVPPVQRHPGLFSSPMLDLRRQSHVGAAGPAIAERLHASSVSSGGERPGILSDRRVTVAVGEGHGENSGGAGTHCSKSPQRPLVRFPQRGKLCSHEVQPTNHIHVISNAVEGRGDWVPKTGLSPMGYDLRPSETETPGGKQCGGFFLWVHGY